MKKREYLFIYFCSTKKQQLEDLCVRMRTPLLGIKFSEKGKKHTSGRAFTGKLMLEWVQTNLGYTTEEATR